MNVLFQESYVREVQDEGLPDPFRNVEMTAAELEGCADSGGDGSLSYEFVMGRAF